MKARELLVCDGPKGRNSKASLVASPESSQVTPADPVFVPLSRIEAHAGEAFEQLRGARFAYRAAGGHVVPARTVQQIPKSHLARALERFRLSGPGGIQHARGPSYIYAILMDPRIKQGDW